MAPTKEKCADGVWPQLRVTGSNNAGKQIINVLPVGGHTGEPSDAFKELRNVIVHPRGNYQAKLPARLHIPAKPLMPHAPTPDNPAVAVKRTLLGIRQSCPAGYGYCYSK
ncbi:hypothetical protein XPA_002238 [Xanthoria parietina]